MGSIEVAHQSSATHKVFARVQEAIRKDVERGFGILQARFAFTKTPCRLWQRVDMTKAMYCCIVLHNMLIDERVGGVTLDATTDFCNDQVTSTDMVTLWPQDIKNLDIIRDNDAHTRLKRRLIQCVWNKFGACNWEEVRSLEESGGGSDSSSSQGDRAVSDGEVGLDD